MGWNELTPEDARKKLTAAEVTAMTNFDDQMDELPGVVAEVVQTIRGQIQQRQPLGAEGTIPDSCRAQAIAWCVAQWLKKFPGPLLTDDRKDAGARAEKYFESVAKGDIRVETPDVVFAQPVSRPGFQRISSRAREATTEHTKGL